MTDEEMTDTRNTFRNEWMAERRIRIELERQNADLHARHGECHEALKIARRYIEAVIFNSPNPKKQKSYGECLAIIDQALSPNSKRTQK